jgi:hypothetical protein
LSYVILPDALNVSETKDRQSYQDFRRVCRSPVNPTLESQTFGPV